LADAERRVERCQTDAQTERGRRAELERAYLELERAHGLLEQQYTALAPQLGPDTSREPDECFDRRSDQPAYRRSDQTFAGDRPAGLSAARSGRPSVGAQTGLRRRVVIVGRRGVLERYVSLQRRYARLQAEHLLLLEQVESTETAGSS